MGAQGPKTPEARIMVPGLVQSYIHIHTLIILVLWRLKQENFKLQANPRLHNQLQASLDYITSCRPAWPIKPDSVSMKQNEKNVNFRGMETETAAMPLLEGKL